MDNRKTNFFILVIILFITVLGGYKIFTDANSEQLTTPSVSPSPSAQASITTELNLINEQTSALQATDITNTQTPAPQQTQQTTQQVKQYRAFPGILEASELTNKKAVIKTNKGSIEFEIYAGAPKAASNFIFLTKDGFYDGLTFHRVENWVVQGGDPTGTGRGNPGYLFEDEPVKKQYTKGTVAMANAGPNTNGSQFFILTRDTPLEPKYTIFGKIITGQEIVDNMNIGDVMQQVTIEQLKP